MSEERRIRNAHAVLAFYRNAYPPPHEPCYLHDRVVTELWMGFRQYVVRMCRRVSGAGIPDHIHMDPAVAALEARLEERRRQCLHSAFLQS
jgi:hypothetical protein